MKRSIFLVLVGLFCFANLTNAACPTGHVISGNMGTVCSASPCQEDPKFWCLSGGANNNNGTYLSWWNTLTGDFSGNWLTAGVNGCCGMWDPDSFPARSTMAKVEQEKDEGTNIHACWYGVHVCERPTAGSGFLCQKLYDYNMREIPSFTISVGMTSTGPGGITTISLSGWGSAVGPAHYWIQLQNGTSGTNLPPSNICSPGGTGPCPAPIRGYQIRAITTGCADGTCDDPTPAKPTTGIASDWNLTVGGGGTINGRTPTFPIAGVTIQNPATCTPAN